MPVLPGGDAANDNTRIETVGPLRLDLAPKPWSGTAPVAETVAWIGAAWSTPPGICPAPESRPMATGPD